MHMHMHFKCQYCSVYNNYARGVAGCAAVTAVTTTSRKNCKFSQFHDDM